MHSMNCVATRPSTTRYIATSFARLPASVTPDFVNLPTSVTIRQVAHVDTDNTADDRADTDRDLHDLTNYRRIHFLVNGTPVPYLVNIHALREALA
ncbi:hypothetical protein SPRG_16918 [Saprolegnia parasitica CBS 223.65]|uniref:Uncharacterized protein n=1 Tax=Saprolegnia parasitica (strain CBS 223.65) TaxID=695850 RepID=A0A067BH63_SAPPC|nr:hypothetical protein SPRG_16918 [Saprolegnia parasitica CBS 223.65]KDO17684.1 hypothetical protein SPRG_16918 [Saprolegnia parasitica CBS 223.65]|eukprot:XP_012211610.1 hypothetical protein SPRG_16918 [Saprolegnia parasitica CBS 223.65]